MLFLAKMRAVASPIPEVAPVIKAFLFMGPNVLVNDKNREYKNGSAGGMLTHF